MLYIYYLNKYQELEGNLTYRTLDLRYNTARKLFSNIER